MPHREKHIEDQNQHLDTDEYGQPVSRDIGDHTKAESGNGSDGVARCWEDIDLDYAIACPLGVKVEVGCPGT